MDDNLFWEKGRSYNGREAVEYTCCGAVARIQDRSTLRVYRKYITQSYLLRDREENGTLRVRQKAKLGPKGDYK